VIEASLAMPFQYALEAMPALPAWLEARASEMTGRTVPAFSACA
jgi:hypothetical protein